MGKVFAYARVSTPRQGQGVSLPEQRSAIERYAEQHNLTIIRWFEERESAAKTGRSEFDTMLRLLRLKVAEGVIIHKIDRSMRNLEDWVDLGKLVDSGADLHFATENLDLKTVAGRLSADIHAVWAAHYSRNLREEVKKGLYGRLKQGYYPLHAPLGYLDQGAAKPKIIDPVRGPLVREAFELYGTGTLSLPNLAKEMFRRGLRNRTGNPVSVSGITVILKNPFYIGIMRVKGADQTYPGKHEPLIPTTLFERAQQVMSGKRVDRNHSHVFTYSRIVQCGTCGYSLIAEKRKGHVYYRCHNRPFKNPAICPPTSIREDRLEAAVFAVLAQVDLTNRELKAARTVVEERRRQSETEHRKAEQTLRIQNDQIESRISKLADLLVEGTIERSLYGLKQGRLLIEQAAIRERMKDLEHGKDLTATLLERTVELAKSPSNLFKLASVEEKRDLLKTLLSNLTVSSKNVVMTLAPPFQSIANRQNSTKSGLNRGTCRTWEQILEGFVTNPETLPQNI